MSDEYASSPAACIERILARKRNQLLDYSLQFLGSTQRGVAVAVSDELPLQVRQKGTTLVAWQP